jgi:hypothetical protein
MGAIERISLEREIAALRADNGRLRWRHRDTLPDWNDLPDELRERLADIGRQMIDEHYGADTMVAVWNEIQKALKP